MAHPRSAAVTSVPGCLVGWRAVWDSGPRSRYANGPTRWLTTSDSQRLLAGVLSQEQWRVMAAVAGDSNARAAIVHYVVDALVGASGSGQLQQSSKVRDGIDERIGQVRRGI